MIEACFGLCYATLYYADAVIEPPHLKGGKCFFLSDVSFKAFCLSDSRRRIRKGIIVQDLEERKGEEKGKEEEEEEEE